MKTHHTSSPFPAIAQMSFAILFVMGSVILAQSVNGVSEPADTNSSSAWTVDSEQRLAATEEFQAVDDRTTELAPEEMPAYWRVMSWILQQPLEQLRREPSASPVFNQFVQQPDSKRGQLMKLDLNVCRVLSYSVPENRLGLQNLYEVWGWTGESQAWLYVVVTPELPAGFPTGVEVSERATCYGYFFKLQGYLEAGAAPRARPLPAPMLLGRLEWNQRLKPRVAAYQDVNWVLGIGVVVGALIAGRLVLMATQKRRRANANANANRKSADRRGEDAVTADEWLSGIQRVGPASASPLPPESSEPDSRFRSL